MNNNLTAIYVLIDGSGSMETMRQAVIDSFNEFIMDQKKQPGTVIFSMAQFNSEWVNNATRSLTNSHYGLNYKSIHHFVHLEKVDKLTRYNYVPNGGTPLLAAMDKGIDELGEDLASMPEHERPSKVVFMVITDGEENQSDRAKFSKSGLLEKIKHQSKVYNWQFVYLGANQDSFAEAGGIGIATHSTMNYEPTYAGMKHAVMYASAATASYRGGLTNSVDLTGTADVITDLTAQSTDNTSNIIDGLKKLKEAEEAAKSGK